MQNVVTTLNVVVMLSAVGPVGIVLPSKSTISQVLPGVIMPRAVLIMPGVVVLSVFLPRTCNNYAG
jgi:hypothetical protein